MSSDDEARSIASQGGLSAYELSPEKKCTESKSVVNSEKNTDASSVDRYMPWPLSDYEKDARVPGKKHNTRYLIELILEGGLKLNCISPVISKAMLFAHHLQKSDEAMKYDPAMLAAATLTLSCAAYDETLNKTIVVLTFHHMIKKEYLRNLRSEAKITLEKYLKLAELFVFKVLGGITCHEMAHEYGLFYAQNLQTLTEVNEVWKPFITNVWKILSDFYTSELCLNYKACDIAIVAINVALLLCKVKSSLPPNWYQEFSPDLTVETKNQLLHDIFTVCGLN
ncbi:cyclin-Q-like [Stegodyphus dumicola]|uniref:cyclin-Q-like n=1 Tax=Stegodyphus dumicola TaxID=202533 RepID=UPI0015ADD937|nr:cyclin-Q-like [Stegodyphus dumicola]